MCRNVSLDAATLLAVRPEHSSLLSPRRDRPPRVASSARRCSPPQTSPLAALGPLHERPQSLAVEKCNQDLIAQSGLSLLIHSAGSLPFQGQTLSRFRDPIVEDRGSHRGKFGNPTHCESAMTARFTSPQRGFASARGEVRAQRGVRSSGRATGRSAVAAFTGLPVGDCCKLFAKTRGFKDTSPSPQRGFASARGLSIRQGAVLIVTPDGALADQMSSSSSTASAA